MDKLKFLKKTSEIRQGNSFPPVIKFEALQRDKLIFILEN